MHLLRRARIPLATLSAIQLMIAVSSLPQSAFAQATLQITSPASGTLVVPGQQVSVVVAVSGGTFGSVAVIPQGLAETSRLSSPPYVFQFTAPSGLTGPLKLTAVGITSPAAPIFSQSVVINVEPPASGLSGIGVNLSAMWFSFVGEQLPILVSANFKDGTITDIRSSPQISYLTSNASVVTVDSKGVATATGAGNATITINYGGQSNNVSVSVPASIPGDLNNDGRVDIDDVNILSSYLNTPPNSPNDARDLNHDGIINALDARILTTLCTHARCTAQ